MVSHGDEKKIRTAKMFVTNAMITLKSWDTGRLQKSKPARIILLKNQNRNLF